MGERDIENGRQQEQETVRAGGKRSGGSRRRQHVREVGEVDTVRVKNSRSTEQGGRSGTVGGPRIMILRIRLQES